MREDRIRRNLSLWVNVASLVIPLIMVVIAFMKLSSRVDRLEADSQAVHSYLLEMRATHKDCIATGSEIASRLSRIEGMLELHLKPMAPSSKLRASTTQPAPVSDRRTSHDQDQARASFSPR